MFPAQQIFLKMCVFADNMLLVSGKKDELLLADENASSPAAHASPVLNDASTAADQQSLHSCSCIKKTSSLSPTHAMHCFLNTAVTSNMISEFSASGDSDRRQG